VDAATHPRAFNGRTASVKAAKRLTPHASRGSSLEEKRLYDILGCDGARLEAEPVRVCECAITYAQIGTDPTATQLCTSHNIAGNRGNPCGTNTARKHECAVGQRHRARGRAIPPDAPFGEERLARHTRREAVTR